MEIHDWPTERYPSPFGGKKGSLALSRPAVIIVLATCVVVILILAPIILLTSLNAGNGASGPGKAVHRIIPPTATPTPSPTPTPTPKPTPTPPPAPIKPFPTTFTEQLAVMQADGRFFSHGNTRIPEIALTFDDGPNPPYTNQILAILQRYHVKATFFCVGSQVARYPELVKEEYRAGHTIGNHTWGHPNMPALSIASIIWQLTTAGDVIQQAIGQRPTFFRPPYGAISSSVLTYANYFGLTVVQWNVDPRDWSRPGADVIYQRVLTQTSAGSIILLHDGGGDRSQTVTALPMIIEWFQSHHFQFVTLPGLVRDWKLIPGRHTTTPS